jgi:hypothetical protein
MLRNLESIVRETAAVSGPYPDQDEPANIPKHRFGKKVVAE